MAIETFNWPIQTATQPTLEVKDRIRKAQFGDGYEQVTGDGINPSQFSFPYSFTGPAARAMEIYNFLSRHKTKSFVFTPPYAEKGLYRVAADSLKRSVKGKTLLIVTATFEQAFAP